jgi:hypothetical protein
MPRALGNFLFCVAVALGLPAADIFAVPPAASPIDRWVMELGSDAFAVREAAAANLISGGEPNIQPLLNCMLNGSPEAAWRAASVLQQIADRSDQVTFGRIVTLLERQSDQNQKIDRLIAELTRKRVAYRRGVALAKIRSLGGRFGGENEPQVVASPPSKIPSPDPPPELPSAEAIPDGQFITPTATETLIADAYVSPLLVNELPAALGGESLTIDQNWRGGDDGLVPLCDVPELSVLSLNRAPLTDAALETIAKMPAIQSLEIDNTPFSTAALNRFRQRQPQTRVLARGMVSVEARTTQQE